MTIEKIKRTFFILICLTLAIWGIEYPTFLKKLVGESQMLIMCEVSLEILREYKSIMLNIIDSLQEDKSGRSKNNIKGID